MGADAHMDMVKLVGYVGPIDLHASSPSVVSQWRMSLSGNGYDMTTVHHGSVRDLDAHALLD